MLPIQMIPQVCSRQLLELQKGQICSCSAADYYFWIKKYDISRHNFVNNIEVYSAIKSDSYVR